MQVVAEIKKSNTQVKSFQITNSPGVTNLSLNLPANLYEAKAKQLYTYASLFLGSRGSDMEKLGSDMDMKKLSSRVGLEGSGL